VCYLSFPGPLLVERGAVLGVVECRIDEFAGVGILGVLEDLVHLSHFHDVAIFHHDHPIADVGDHPEVVRDDDERHSILGLQFPQEFKYFCLDRDVESGRGFVGKQQGGLAHHRAGNEHPLGHSTGLAAIMDWRGIFLVLAGIGVALPLLAITSLPETLPHAKRQTGPIRQVGNQFVEVFRDRVFVALLLVAACGGVAFFTYLASISFVLQSEMGMSPQAFSVIFAANSIMTVLGSQIDRFVVRKAGLRRMYMVGTTSAAAVSLVVLLIAVVGPHPVLLLSVIALMMCCHGITSPNGAALTLTSHGERAGTAAALFGTSTFVIGPLLAPLASLGGTSSLSMATMIAIGSVAGALLAWTVALPLLRTRADANPPARLPNRGTPAIPPQ